MHRHSIAPLAVLLMASGCPDSGDSGDGTDSEAGDTTAASTMTTASTMTGATSVDTGSVTTADDTTGGTTEDTTGDSADSNTTSDTTDGDTSGSTTAETDGTTAGGAPEVELSIDGMVVASGATVPIPDTVDVGATATAVVVTVANVGDAPLDLGALTVQSGDDSHFVLDGAALGTTLDAGDTSSFDVTFAPTNGGIKSITVALATNDADEDPSVLTFDGHTTPNVYRQVIAANPTARFNSAMVALADDRVLLFGGRDATGARLNDTWIFDVESETWSAVAVVTPPSARDGHAMAYLDNDTVLLFGGNDTMGGGSIGFDDTWSFDVATEQWSEVMVPGPGPRFQHMMVSLGDDALVFGGRSNFNELDDTWRWDAVAAGWALLPNTGVPSARMTAAMAFDGDDTVVLFGGFIANVPQSDTLEFSATTNTWSAVPTPATPGARAVLEAAALETGELMVFSGKDSCCAAPETGTWLYDPALQTWTEVTPPSEPAPRFNYAMTSIPERNKILMFGGLTENIQFESALDTLYEYVGPVP